MTTPQNITDLRSWHAAALPVCIGWNYTGFPISWYADRLREGLRIIPPIFTPNYDFPETSAGPASTNKVFPYFYDYASGSTVRKYLPDLSYIGSLGIPVALRMNNIPQSFCGPRYRAPKPWTAMPPDSAMVWRRMDDGSLDDVAQADYLGPIEHWRKEGELLGGCPYFQQVKQYVPSPANLVLLSNDEGSYGSSPTKVDQFDKDGKLVAQGVADFLTANPTQLTPDGLAVSPDMKWKLVETIAKVSIRLAERVAAGLAESPWKEFLELTKRTTAKYLSFYDGFEQNQPWAETKLLTASYSSGRKMDWQNPKFVTDEVGWSKQWNDGVGPNFYLNYQGFPWDLTSPLLTKWIDANRVAWEFKEARNPDAFRMLFTWINGTGALRGAKEGKHQPVSPEMWGAITAWLCWTYRKPGRAFAIIPWVENDAKADAPMFNAAQQADLLAMGADFGNATWGDYHTAAARALNPILDNPVIRRFWEEGTPASHPAPVDAWCAASKLNGDKLLYRWSAKDSHGFPAGWYTFVRDGVYYTLDEYTALTTKTPFELLAESKPELADPNLPAIDKDFGDKVLRIINAVRP